MEIVESVENILPNQIEELAIRYCKRIEKLFSMEWDIFTESEKNKVLALKRHPLGTLTAEMLYENFSWKHDSWNKIYVKGIRLYTPEEHTELVSFFSKTTFDEVQKSLLRILSEHVPTSQKYID